MQKGRQLNITGQNSEYSTPNNIAELMAEMGKLTNPKSIIDICCGTGNILSFCKYSDDLEGVELNIEAANIARINNPKATITVGDVLNKTTDKKYDLVFGDFPFGLKIKRGPITSYGESLFIKKGLELLNNEGVLICIVPIGFLYRDNFIDIRKEIIDSYALKLIVNLPAGIFPYTFIRSSILYVQKTSPEEKVYLFDYKNNKEEIISNYSKKTGRIFVLLNELCTNWNLGYRDSEFIEIENKLKGEVTKLLTEIADIIPGYSPKPGERLDKGEFLLFSGRNIKDGAFRQTGQDKYINSVDHSSFQKAVLRPGDIIVNLLFAERKLYIFKQNDPKCVLSRNCALIRSPQNEYILAYLKTKEGQRIFLKQAERMTNGKFIPKISVRDLEAIRIPILPLDNLHRISEQEIAYSSPQELKELISELDLGLGEKFGEPVKKFWEEMKTKLKLIISAKEILSKIKGGETKRLEFKSSLRWNVKSNNIDKNIENSVLKTIVAFCNSEGGELLIGVNDEGTILGIELDKFPNEDKYLLHLEHIITERIVPKVIEYVDYKIIDADNKRICQVICKKSPKAIWFKADNSTVEQFFVRSGPSSKPLPPMEAFEYIHDHFK